MTLLLRVLTGSRLYGTHHENSDWDWYEVHDKIKAQHVIVNGQDVQRWPLSLFVSVAAKGGHNALDLMFCPSGWPEVDLLGDFRSSYYAEPRQARKRFLATIEAMHERGDEKSKMHALRMQDNLDSIELTGRYNPVWRNNGKDDRKPG